ncbi:MAG: Uncharacterized protein FD145_675 [Candidatus Saganbacteria bacterium]|uniref:Lipoprotein n=1 Tax=Candidatus Saganbacteria bacterium TaxID=2575572 RepID=A0A833L1F3_UNCSA|nr:MAG: Uncharacterized protein FD145_675 [Candidatus Saganbacteria bacterium]
MFNKLLPVLGVLMMLQTSGLGAVGCDLNEPDRDVKRFFSEMTSYKTEYFSVKKSGGEKLYELVQQRYGAKFKGLYETIDVPYTVYTVLIGKTVVGYIHGVNQKGKYGGLQVFLALDPKGIIIQQYFQKMTGSYAGKFRDRAFSSQFAGLSLADFIGYDVNTGKIPPKSKLNQIINPVPAAVDDFSAALSGIKKNLILMNIFVFSQKEAGK